MLVNIMGFTSMKLYIYMNGFDNMLLPVDVLGCCFCLPYKPGSPFGLGNPPGLRPLNLLQVPRAQQPNLSDVRCSSSLPLTEFFFFSPPQNLPQIPATPLIFNPLQQQVSQFSPQQQSSQSATPSPQQQGEPVSTRAKGGGGRLCWCSDTYTCG